MQFRDYAFAGAGGFQYAALGQIVESAGCGGNSWQHTEVVMDCVGSIVKY